MEKCGTARPATHNNIIWRMRIACWIPKSTNTRSDCVICIPFTLEQWLHERASILRHTYVTCHLISLSSTPFKKDDPLNFVKFCNMIFSNYLFK
jgi:hypothetical protein